MAKLGKGGGLAGRGRQTHPPSPGQGTSQARVAGHEGRTSWERARAGAGVGWASIAAGRVGDVTGEVAAGM